MPARLIVNADDFGLTPGINRAIAELHSAGVLTSATLMASGPAFDDAINIARAHPDLGVGCHVVLTDGTPVSPPRTIPTLIGADGKKFRPKLTRFVSDLLLGRIDEADISHEAQAQIELLQSSGISVSHIDTHKHTHIFPRVARPLLAIAERLGVTAVRNPFESPWSLALSDSPLLRSLQLRATSILRPRFLALPQIVSGKVIATEGTIGISATGNLTEVTLAAILMALPAGTWELVCHPGYNDRDLDAITTRLRITRDVERNALLEMSKIFSLPNAPNLINYMDL
jgi:hopanoid biosynthesis associated protein HpnK